MLYLLSILLDRLFAPAPLPARVAWLHGVTYAHRGLHGAGLPENSPAAFAADPAPKVFVTGHLGSWEVAVQVLERVTGRPGAAVVRRAVGIRSVVARTARAQVGIIVAHLVLLLLCVCASNDSPQPMVSTRGGGCYPALQIPEVS